MLTTNTHSSEATNARRVLSWLLAAASVSAHRRRVKAPSVRPLRRASLGPCGCHTVGDCNGTSWWRLQSHQLKLLRPTIVDRAPPAAACTGKALTIEHAHDVRPSSKTTGTMEREQLGPAGRPHVEHGPQPFAVARPLRSGTAPRAATCSIFARKGSIAPVKRAHR